MKLAAPALNKEVEFSLEIEHGNLSFGPHCPRGPAIPNKPQLLTVQLSGSWAHTGIFTTAKREQSGQKPKHLGEK